MWEGDYYFLEKLDQKDTFVMHLYYKEDKLVKAVDKGDELDV